jgi:hypothetical protein
VTRRLLETFQGISDGIASFGEFLDAHPWLGPTVMFSVLIVVVVTR